jgi:hypothetical protein
MKLKIPVIRTREDYYRALFGTPRDEAEEASPVLDRLRAGAEKRKKDLEGRFYIQELPDRYRFHNLEYHDGIYTVDWSKELLEGGEKHIQEDWMELTQSAEWQKKNGVWQIPCAPLYHATIAALFENQDHPVGEQQDLVQAVRELFKKDFVSYLMMTGTRAKYAAKGRDVVTHDWNTPHARTVKGTFVGPNWFVDPSCGFDDVIQALLETNDLQLIEEAYEWIGEQGKKPYLFRINNQPTKDVERAVVLGVNYGRFYIDANDGVSSRPARGVVTQGKKIIP